MLFVTPRMARPATNHQARDWTALQPLTPPHPRPTPSPIDKQVVTLPSFEVFYRGSRVAQVSGPQLDQVELKVKQFGYAVSKTDLFSDDGEYGGGGSERDENGDFAWDRMADKTARDSKK